MMGVLGRMRETLWYVAQVYTGKEERLVRMCREQVSSGVLVRCFVPYCERMKRYLGEWHKEREVLFPGYVFMVTSQVDRLNEELKGIPMFARILGNGGLLLPLSPGEVAFLERLGGGAQVVAMSLGVVENDQVRILDGPMAGLEGYIRRIDRHKRQARIEVEMFGRILEATVGLEIVGKSRA